MPTQASTAVGAIAHLIAAVRLKRAAWRFTQLALSAIDAEAKANFDPNQPRVPIGNPDGGQWTDAGLGGAVHHRSLKTPGELLGADLSAEDRNQSLRLAGKSISSSSIG